MRYNDSFHDLPDPPAVVLVGDFLLAVHQFAKTFLFRFPIDLIGIGIRRGPFFARIGESPNVIETHFVQKAEGLLMIGFAFPGEAADEGGSRDRVGNPFPDLLEKFDDLFLVAVPFHGLKHPIGSGLDGDIEIMGDGTARGDEADQFFADLVGI